MTRRPAATCAPALIFGVLPSSLFAYATESSSNSDEVVIGSILAGLWVGTVTNLTSQGALARVVLDEGDALIAASMRPVLRALASLVAAGALVGAATLAAGAFALLPGLLLHALWSVAGPAIVEDRLRPLAALRRSAALVRPVFWRVVLLNTLLIMGYLAFWIALALAALYLWYGPAVFTDEWDGVMPLALYLLSAPFLAAATAAWSAIVVALYAELRERLDGEPADRLARIFA